MGETDTATLAPRDFDALRGLILGRRNEMPKRLAQVAAYALEHPDEVAFGTAASVAVSAGVQPSTLVRLARHLGFEGFSDLQNVFRARLRERTGSYEERLTALRKTAAQGSKDQAALHGFLAAAGRSVEALSASLDPSRFENAAALLADAGTIYLVARRRSYPVATYLAYAFGKLGIRYVLTGSAAGLDPETLQMAQPQDAAIAISFSPYASDTVEHARLLADRGVSVVAVTDSAFSPLVSCAAEWLEVAEADFSGFRSLSATMALVMALSVAVAERRRAG